MAPIPAGTVVEVRPCGYQAGRVHVARVRPINAWWHGPPIRQTPTPSNSLFAGRYAAVRQRLSDGFFRISATDTGERGCSSYDHPVVDTMFRWMEETKWITAAQPTFSNPVWRREGAP